MSDHAFLAKVSEKLYESRRAAESFVSGYRDVQSFEREGVRVLFFRNLTQDFVCINGTDDVEDWVKYNLRATQVDTDYGKIHSGFLKAAKIVSEMWGEWAAGEDFPWHTHVFGHSLGGAIAQVFALFHSTWIDEVTTFGSPRVGDFEFTKSFAPIKATRYVFEYDFVTALPWMFGAYVHAGEPTQLGGSRAWWFVRALFSLIPKATGLTKLNHNISQYVAALEDYA
jgi:predicted lipase